MSHDDVFVKIKQQWINEAKKPKVVLHACCAPCATYVLEELANISDLTIFFSNSNIHPKEEYLLRSAATKQFINQFNKTNQTNVLFVEDEYKPDMFVKEVFTNQLQDQEEGKLRCSLCFNLRLDAVASFASQNNFDYFGTSLTVSPLKNSEVINTQGLEIALIYDVSYLPSDFKKRGGYQRSIQLSKQYDIYRQCYCGCAFSAAANNLNIYDLKCQAAENALKFIKDYEKLDE